MTRKALSRRELVRGGVAGVVALPASARGAAESPALEALIFVWLRGGADALSLVVPYGDAEYRRARPRLAIAAPGSGADAALALDAELGLHPRLPALKACFDRGELGVLVGVGHSRAIHGHRDAALALEGAIAAAAGGAAIVRADGPLEAELARLGRAVRAGSAPPAALIEAPGWDTHVGQGAARAGRLADAVSELDRAIASYRGAIGEALPRARLIVVTEFGRSLSETLLAGTDDGEASVLFALGGPRLGRVTGGYGSLAPAALGASGGPIARFELERALGVVARGGWIA